MKLTGLILLNILLVLVLCTAVCLFLKVRLHIKFSKHHCEEFRYETSWALFGGKFKKNLNFDGTKKKSDKKSKRKKEKKQLTVTEKLEWLRDTFDRIREIQSKTSSKTRKSVFFQRIHLKISFGLEDAFVTGTSIGIIWAVLYNLVAIISRFFHIAEPEFEVTPVYDEEIFDAEGECIVSFRLVNIIFALISVGISYYKTKPKHNKN